MRENSRQTKPKHKVLSLGLPGGRGNSKVPGLAHRKDCAPKLEEHTQLGKRGKKGPVPE